MIELFIGGCRSGKSRAALERANHIGARRKIFIATCQPLDAEMRARIERHQEERDATWDTLEEPVGIANLIRSHSDPQTVILVDCLTLWLTNLILQGADDAALQEGLATLADSLSEARGSVLLVANEVGLGIVPENAMSRRFRDWAGSLNQKMAQCAQRVVWTVAGIPVPIKPPSSKGPALAP
jgi:adenosylcobinamide kinase/adenosylcobinamide-phosphate guanylyltransferase